MAGLTLTIRDNTGRLIRRLDRVDRIVQRTALAVEAGAKRKAPVKTGYLRATIRARRLGEAQAAVDVGAHYGVYVELGARRRPARPYLAPALEEAKTEFERAVRTVLEEGEA